MPGTVPLAGREPREPRKPHSLPCRPGGPSSPNPAKRTLWHVHIKKQPVPRVLSGAGTTETVLGNRSTEMMTYWHGDRVTATVLLVCVVAGAPGKAAFLQSDYPATEGTRRVVPPPLRDPPPRPRPERENPLQRLVRGIRVSAPATHGHTTVFFLSLDHRAPVSNPLSLAEAHARNWLEIAEAHVPSVPSVRIRNNGSRPVLLVAGQLLTGGKQNRSLATDVLLPERSDWIRARVYCVERGRWVDQHVPLRPAGTIAHPSLRRQCVTGAAQETVWDQVSAERDL